LSGRFGGQRPLPLPSLPTRRTRDTRYAVTAVDAGGRLGDRALLEFLGWPPGTPLVVETTAQPVIVVVAAPSGAQRVTARGHLRLPAALRHRCGLRAGERLLLAAERDGARLLIYPAAALDALLPDPAVPPADRPTGGRR